MEMDGSAISFRFQSTMAVVTLSTMSVCCVASNMFAIAGLKSITTRYLSSSSQMCRVLLFAQLFAHLLQGVITIPLDVVKRLLDDESEYLAHVSEFGYLIGLILFYSTHINAVVLCIDRKLVQASKSYATQMSSGCFARGLVIGCLIYVSGWFLIPTVIHSSHSSPRDHMANMLGIPTAMLNTENTAATANNLTNNLMLNSALTSHKNVIKRGGVFTHFPEDNEKINGFLNNAYKEHRARFQRRHVPSRATVTTSDNFDNSTASPSLLINTVTDQAANLPQLPANYRQVVDWRWSRIVFFVNGFVPFVLMFFCCIAVYARLRRDKKIQRIIKQFQPSDTPERVDSVDKLNKSDLFDDSLRRSDGNENDLAFTADNNSIGQLVEKHSQHATVTAPKGNISIYMKSLFSSPKPANMQRGGGAHLGSSTPLEDTLTSMSQSKEFDIQLTELVFSVCMWRMILVAPYIVYYVMRYSCPSNSCANFPPTEGTQAGGAQRRAIENIEMMLQMLVYFDSCVAPLIYLQKQGILQTLLAANRLISGKSTAAAQKPDRVSAWWNRESPLNRTQEEMWWQQQEEEVDLETVRHVFKKQKHAIR